MVSAVLIIGGLLLVAGFRQGTNQRYIVVFDKTVLGLYKGGMVQYLGVPVGLVDDIYVSSDGKAYVEMLINPKKVALHRGVEAKLEFYSFATGTMCVALSGGDPTAEILPVGSIIPTGQSQIETFSSQAADLMNSMNDITEKIQSGMKNMKEDQITEVVDQVKPFIDDARQFIADARNTLASVQADLHTTIENAQPGIKKFTEFADNAAKMTKTADDTLKDVRSKIEPVDLAKIQEQLLALTTQLQQTTKRLHDMAGSLPYTVDNIQHSLVQTTQQLNETMAAFRELAQTLNDNSLVRGKASPEEKP